MMFVWMVLYKDGRLREVHIGRHKIWIVYVPQDLFVSAAGERQTAEAIAQSLQVQMLLTATAASLSDQHACSALTNIV